MSILDKELSPPPPRVRRRWPFFVIPLVLIILFVLLFTDVHNDATFVQHFLSAPAHFTYSGHADYISNVAWSADSRRVISASGDHTVQIWNALDGGDVFTYKGHSSDVIALAESPDGNYVASADLNMEVQVWRRANGARVTIYQKHTDVVFGLAWSPDSTRVASASNDGTVQIWNALTGQTLLTYKSLALGKGGTTPWNTVAWSPDGQHLAIGGNGNIQVLDASTGKSVASYGYDGGIVHDIAWSPNGNNIAVASSTGTVQLWTFPGGQNIFNFRGHSADVLSVSWSPDGKRIASGSSDGTAQVWDALTGNHAYVYRGHTDYYFGHFTSNALVNTVAWSPDGKHIASGGTDNTVQVWSAPSAD